MSCSFGGGPTRPPSTASPSRPSPAGWQSPATRARCTCLPSRGRLQARTGGQLRQLQRWAGGEQFRVKWREWEGGAPPMGPLAGEVREAIRGLLSLFLKVGDLGWKEGGTQLGSAGLSWAQLNLVEGLRVVQVSCQSTSAQSGRLHSSGCRRKSASWSPLGC